MSRKLYKSLRDQKVNTEQPKTKILGSLGIPLDGSNQVKVSGRPSYVYVRLRVNQNEVIQAFNNTVAPSYDLPVIVVRERGRYVVSGYDDMRYFNNQATATPFLPAHGDTHSFNRNGGGADVVYVYSQQFTPLLLYPSGSLGSNTVLVSPYVIQDIQGKWLYVGATGTSNLAQYAPTGSNAVMALVYIDRTNGGLGLIVNSGTSFSSLLTSLPDVIPFVPKTQNANQIPIGAVRITTGTNTFDWNHIYDLRQFAQPFSTGTSSLVPASGTSSVLSGILGWDEGIPLGTGTILNVVGQRANLSLSGTVFNLTISPDPQELIGFAVQNNGVLLGTGTTLNLVGTNYDISLSGTTARLFITGSTGGTVNPPITGTFVVQNQGQTLGSVTTLNTTAPLFATVSGSVAQILISGTSSTYMRVGQPTSLSSVTGTYWIVPDQVYASGTLALFNQGHDLIPGIDYAEQYPVSGTFQYISTPPTGTYNLVIYGVPATGGGASSSGGGGVTQSYAGYNTIGGSTESPAINNKVYAKKITISSAGMLSSIGAYVGTASGTAMGPSVAIYTDNAGPDKLIAGTPGSGILINPSSGFRWIDLPVGVWLTAGDYWIAIRTTDLGGAAACQIKYDGSGSDKTGNMAAVAWYDWSNVGSVSTTTNNYSIRASVIR